MRLKHKILFSMYVLTTLGVTGCGHEVIEEPIVQTTTTVEEITTTTEVPKETEVLIKTEASVVAEKWILSLMNGEYEKAFEVIYLPKNTFMTADDIQWLSEQERIPLVPTGSFVKWEGESNGKVGNQSVVFVKYYVETENSAYEFQVPLLKNQGQYYVYLDEFVSDVTFIIPKDVLLSMNGVQVETSTWKESTFGEDKIPCLTGKLTLLRGRDYSTVYVNNFGQFFRVLNLKDGEIVNLSYIRDNTIENYLVDWISNTWLQIVTMYGEGATDAVEYKKFFTQDVKVNSLSKLLNSLKVLCGGKTNFKVVKAAIDKETATSGVLAMVDNDTLYVKFQIDYEFNMETVTKMTNEDGDEIEVTQISDEATRHYKNSALFVDKVGDNWYLIQSVPHSELFEY